MRSNGADDRSLRDRDRAAFRAAIHGDTYHTIAERCGFDSPDAAKAAITAMLERVVPHDRTASRDCELRLLRRIRSEASRIARDPTTSPTMIRNVSRLLVRIDQQVAALTDHLVAPRVEGVVRPLSWSPQPVMDMEFCVGMLDALNSIQYPIGQGADHPLTWEEAAFHWPIGEGPGTPEWVACHPEPLHPLVHHDAERVREYRKVAPVNAARRTLLRSVRMNGSSVPMLQELLANSVQRSTALGLIGDHHPDRQ